MRGSDDGSVRRLVQWAMVQFGCEVAMMVQMKAHMACDDSSDESSHGLR